MTEGPPTGLASGVKDALETQGYRVLDPRGKPLVDVWLRKGAPASAKPSGPKGAILYPVLAEGELLGAVKFASEGRDYRDQAITPGVYTLRYGLQPVNGDHLGVSVNRDYVLLVPAARTPSRPTCPARGSSRGAPKPPARPIPACSCCWRPPEKLPEAPTMVNDETLNTWGAIVSLPLEVKGEAEPRPLGDAARRGRGEDGLSFLWSVVSGQQRSDQ